MPEADIRAKFNPAFREFAAQWGMCLPLLVEFDPNNVNDVLAILDTTKLPVYNQALGFGFLGLAAGTMNSAILLGSSPAVRMMHVDYPLFGLSQVPKKRVDPLTYPIDTIDTILFKSSETLGKLLQPVSTQTGQATAPNPLQTMLQAPLLPLTMPFQLLSGAGGGQFTPLTPNRQGQHPIPQGFRKDYFATIDTRTLVGADLAESEGITGQGVTVAILDTGADKLHPQLLGIKTETAMPQPPPDENGHGSHCASTAIGKEWVNPYNIPLKGVAPQARGIAIKCLGGLIGAGRASDIIKAIEMAITLKADVISMSLGSKEAEGGLANDPIVRAVKAATQLGKICVIAGGNSGDKAGTIGNPGCSPDALTVGAYDPRTGQIAKFSSRGPIYNLTKPDISAPGVDIYSGVATGSLLDGLNDKLVDSVAILSGTSMACPHVAGLMALLRQKFPSLTVEQVKAVCAARGHAKDNDEGFGKINYSWFKA